MIRSRVLPPVLASVLFAAAAVSAAAASPLRISAASSLGAVFVGLAPAARISLAGSDELATQIRAGAPADLFASASPTYTQGLFRDGLVERPVAFAGNRLVVIVPRSNPAGLRSVANLARPGVKVVLASPAVPAGAYAREALRRLGLAKAVLANLVSNEQDVKSVVAKVWFGQADAGIVYATDARIAASRVAAIAIPSRAQPKIRYEIAVVTRSSRKPEARAFIRRLLSAGGARALRAAGFVPLGAS
ncbi:MAG: molybdate ABC transporter substrate-binding protein [Gaiella sp.]